MTALIVILSIVLLIVLICLIPADLLVKYDHEKLYAQAKIGPVRLSLYPPKPKDEAKEFRKREKKRKKQEKAKKKKQKKSGAAAAPEKKKKKFSRDMIKPLLRAAKDLLGGLRRKLIVRNLTLHVTYGGEDAAEAAINYGRAWAMIGCIMPILENTFRLQKRDVDARLDYDLKKMMLFLQLEIRLRIGAAIGLALRIGFRLMRDLSKNKNDKAVQNNESSSL